MSVATDREATRSSVSIHFKRPREPFARVRDYRSSLVDDLLEQVLDERLEERVARGASPFLFGSVSSGSLGLTAESFGLSASVEDGGIPRGLEALMTEIERIRRHGVLPVELERAKRETLAQSDQDYAERKKTESDGLADDYVSSFLSGDPEVGIEADHALTRSLLPGIRLEELNARVAARVYDHDRVILATAPEKAGLAAPIQRPSCAPRSSARPRVRSRPGRTRSRARG